MFGEKILKPIVTERTATGIWKQRRGRLAVTFLQPSSQRSDGVLAQGRTTLLAPFAATVHMGSAIQYHILAAQADNLCGTQAVSMAAKTCG